MVPLINEHPPDIFVRPYSVHETSRKAKLQINEYAKSTDKFSPYD